MAMQKQSASFTFVGSGLDLKTSAALVGPKNFLQLLNCSLVESSTGRQLQKRNGYIKLTMLDVNGNSVSGGTTLETFQTNQSTELEYIGNGNLYTWSPSINRWIPKGVLINMTPSERSIAKSGYNKANCSSAIVAGIGLYAWEDQQGGVWYSVIDESSGSAFQNSTQISATSSVPKAIAIGGNLHLFVADGANINRYTLNTTTPAVPMVSVTLVSGGIQSVNPSFDMVFLSSGFLGLAYVSNTAKLAVALVNGTTITVALTTVTAQNATWVNVASVNAAMGVIIGLGTGLGMLYGFFNATTLVQVGGYITETTASGGTVPLASGIASITTQTSMYVDFQVEPAGSVDRVIYQRLVDDIGGLGGIVTIARGLGLASSVIQDATGATRYRMVTFTSTVQQTLFVLASGTSIGVIVVGKFFPAMAGPFPVSLTGTYGRIPNFTQTTTGVYSLATTSLNAIVSVNGKPTPINGITELTLDFNQVSTHGVQIGQNLHFSGPIATYYDGQVVAEQNFNVYPEQVTLTQLGSNIGIITTQDGSSDANPVAQPQIVNVIFPVVPGASGTAATQPADASLITPGEWISFGGSIEQGIGNTTALGAGCAFYIYFTVNGVGSDPLFTGSTVFNGKGTVCAINSTDTAAQIATKFFNVIKFSSATPAAFTSALYTPVVTGNLVTLTAAAAGPFAANTYRSRPASGLKFVVNQTWDGPVANKKPICVASCCPGSLIQGGQYFTFLATNLGGTSDIPNYVWFKRDGVGTDPAPTGFTSLGFVNVTTANTAFQVATALTALLVTIPNINATVNGGGNQVVISNQVNLVGFPLTPSTFAQNPYAGGVSWGYLGSYINPGTTSTTSTVGPVLSYQYSEIYESVDNQGQLHRSQPSIAATGYVAVYGQPALYPGGTPPATVPGSGAFTIISKTLRLTSKTSSDIGIFRTQGNGQLFQRVTSPTALLVNIPTQDTLNFTDYMTDAVLAGNEPLYSQITNGVVPNGPPPAAKFITSHQNRLVYCALENQQQVIYSQPIVQGQGVAFSSYYTPITIDPVWGPVIGAASMDGNLVIYTQGNCWVVGGSGPDSTNQGSFSTPSLINSAVGLRDANSLTMTSIGLMAKSLKGIYILDRKLNAHYTGEPIESLNADIITSAQVTNQSTVIRLGSATGTTVQYDFVQNQWSTFSNHPVNDSVLWNNVYYYIRSTDGAVLQENPGSYLDDTTGFTMALTTWWIKPSALVEGETRVWWFYFKGFFNGTNPFQIQLSVDYKPAIVDTKIFNPLGGSSGGGGSGVWGSDPIWGSSSPWGSSGGGSSFPDYYMIRYQPPQHLASAYQLTIQDLAPFQASISWGLDALEMDYGVSDGGRRLPQGATI